MALKNLYFRGVYMKTEWLEWLILYKKYNSLQKVSDICHVTPQNIKKMFNVNGAFAAAHIVALFRGTLSCFTNHVITPLKFYFNLYFYTSVIYLTLPP